MYEKVYTNGWNFSYQIDVLGDKTYSTVEEDANYLYILKQIFTTKTDILSL